MKATFVVLLFLAIVLCGCVQEPEAPELPGPVPADSTSTVFYQPMQCIRPPWGEDDSSQRIKEFYALADLRLESVEKAESGNDVCAACYECQETYYYTAVVLAKQVDLAVALGWLESLPEPSGVSLSYSVEEVFGGGSIAPGRDALAEPPFRATAKLDSGALVLNKRIHAPCFPKVFVYGKLVPDDVYEVRIEFPPKARAEEFCLFDIEVFVQGGLPQGISKVNVFFEGDVDELSVDQSLG